MFGGIRKLPTDCPHCGFQQSEPAGAISTYCRGCGDHFTVTRNQPAPVRPTLATRLPLVAPARTRARIAKPVRCEICGTKHSTSPLLHSSLCPTCGTETELADLHIHSHRTLPVDTRGTVHVSRTGFLNATHTRCGHARIEGRFAGRIDCAGTLRIRGEGVCRSRIETHTLIIDRSSDFRFAFPIRAEEILIRGSVSADIFCPGTIRIGRHGTLEGSVHARSLVVDKGGDYQGTVEVATTIIDNYPRAGTVRSPEVKVAPAWQPLFA